jgi:hypothetical protein
LVLSGVSDRTVLRGTRGPNGEEVTGDWRKLHNEELHNLSYIEVFHLCFVLLNLILILSTQLHYKALTYG